MNLTRVALLAMLTATCLSSPDTSDNSIVQSVFTTIEHIVNSQLHPFYLKARTDPILSNLLFGLLVLVVFNSLVFNVFSVFCRSCCKVERVSSEKSARKRTSGFCTADRT